MTTIIEKSPSEFENKAGQSKNDLVHRTTMQGLVYGGPGKIELKDIPKPGVEKPTDALVKILKTTICGTDLGILHGKTPVFPSEFWIYDVCVDSCEWFEDCTAAACRSGGRGH